MRFYSLMLIVLAVSANGCIAVQEWKKDCATGQALMAEEMEARQEEVAMEREIYRRERQAELNARRAELDARMLDARAETKDVVNLNLNLGMSQEYEVVGKYIDFKELEAKHAAIQKQNEDVKKIIDRANEIRREKHLQTLESRAGNYDLINALGADGQPKNCATPAPPVLEAYAPIEMPAQGLTEDDITWVVKLKSKSRMNQNPTLEARIGHVPTYIPCLDGQGECGACTSCTQGMPCLNKGHVNVPLPTEPIQVPGVVLSNRIE